MTISCEVFDDPVPIDTLWTVTTFGVSYSIRVASIFDRKPRGNLKITVIMSTFSWSIIFAIVPHKSTQKKSEKTPRFPTRTPVFVMKLVSFYQRKVKYKYLTLTPLFLIFFSSSIMMKTFVEKLHLDIYWSTVTSISQSFESKQHLPFTSYYLEENHPLYITHSVSLLSWVLAQKWKYTVKVSLRITCLFAINFELFSEILNSSWNLSYSCTN